MKILIIGGVAAGTKAAAKLLRENRGAQVKVLTKGEDISYAGCGLPLITWADLLRQGKGLSLILRRNIWDLRALRWLPAVR